MTRDLADAYLDRMAELVTGTMLLPAWSPEGKSLGFVDGPADNRTAWTVDLATGEKKELLDIERLRSDIAALTGETPAGRGVPFPAFAYLAEGLISFLAGDRTFVLHLDSATLTVQPKGSQVDDYLGMSAVKRMTPREYKRANPLVDPLPMPELMSPTMTSLLSTRDGNLVLRDVTDGRETALTTDGSAEVEWRFDQTNPMLAAIGLAAPTTCFSPDGTQVAAYRVDNRGVAKVPQVHWLKRGPEVVDRYHAQAGGVLEKSTLHVIDTYDGRVVDLDLGETRDTYPAFAGWLPDGSGLVVFRLSRDCRRADVLLADPRTGATRLLFTEQGESFVRIHHDVYYARKLGLTLTPDGTQLLWLSERDGWQHLYLYDLDGTLVRQLTSGPWPVDSVVRVADGEVWFTGRPNPERPYDKHLLRVPLAGGDVTQVTQEEGCHDCFLSPDARFVIDSHSTPERPVVHELLDSTGSPVVELSRADTSGLDALPRVTAWEEKVLAADGETELWATVYLPPDFDVDGSYPVLDHVYAGQQLAIAAHGFYGTPSGALAAATAAWAQLGYITVTLDARGTPLRSKAFHDVPYPRWASCLADDHAAAIQQLAEKLPIDLGRVGTYGHSWGGYGAFRLAADRPDVFKAAACSAPGFDPYSSILYECYLGLPQDNKAGYDFAQTFTQAAGFQGELLIAVGTSDHPTFVDAVKMSEALIRAGKEHEFVLLPEQYHGYDSVHDAYHRSKFAAFFAKHLA